MRIDRADSEAELLGAPSSSAEIVKVVAGDFEVRLAESAAEIDAAQALRYRVFYEEMTAHPTPEMAARRRDFERTDESHRMAAAFGSRLPVRHRGQENGIDRHLHQG